MELSVRKEFRLYRIAKLIRSKFCCFRKISHTLAKEINNKSLEVSALRSLADINYSLKNFAQAIDFNEKYAALAKSIGETENEILALESIAGIYYNNKEWEKIAESYKRILEIHRRTNNKKAEAETLNFIGVVKSNGENY